jgi:2-phosphosulfolactate phosphatase
MPDQKTNMLEVCFSPALFATYEVKDKIVVLVDILRATSTICTALYKGVKEIIPVATVEEARAYKEKGFMVAGERDGKVLDFADFGNSPFNFMNENIIGKSIVYSTTNGTAAIQMAKGCSLLVIGSYLNHQVLNDWLIKQNKDVIIFCSGWKNKFNLEDTVFAGALSESLLESGKFSTVCDSSLASIDLWKLAKNDLIKYIEKAAHRERLRKLGLDDVLEYCHTFNAAPVIPYQKNDSIIALK